MPQDPLYIHHYTSQLGLLGICAAGAIWATDILYLNDASEFNYAATLALAVLEEYPRGHQEALRLAVDDMRDGRWFGRDEAVYVTSFSEHGNLLSQWRAYCPTSGGVSIGFNVEALANVAAQQRFKLARCVYDQAEQIRIIRPLIEEAAFLSVPEQSRERFLQLLAKTAPLLKQWAFREEAEWRLVSLPISLADPRVRFRPGRSMVLPYVDLGLIDSQGILPIEHVTVGPTPHPELARASVARLLERLCREGRIRTRAGHSAAARLSDVPFRAW